MAIRTKPPTSKTVPVRTRRRLLSHGIALTLLVIHGEADTTVPVTHGRRLAAAYGPGAETLFVPGAEHVRSYGAIPAAYLSRLTVFLQRAERVY